MEKRSIINRVSGSVWLPHGEGVVITVNKGDGGFAPWITVSTFLIISHSVDTCWGQVLRLEGGTGQGKTDYSSGLVDNGVARNVCIEGGANAGSSRK